MEGRQNIINKIVTQRDNYVRLFNDILRTSKDSYMILDIYYTLLNRKGTRLQISVIIMSSLLTCIQAGRSMDENYQDENYQDYIPNNENIINNTSFFNDIFTERSNMIYDIIVLSISTYSSLSLSIMRYFKWDDKREISSELKGKFLELHNRINHQLDILRPWNSDDYYDNFNLDNHYKNWDLLINDIEREYKIIIEVKKSLVTECDKLLTEKERIRFQHKIFRDERFRNRQERKFKQQTLNHLNDIIRIEGYIVENEKRKRELEKNRGNTTSDNSRFIDRLALQKWEISRRLSRPPSTGEPQEIHDTLKGLNNTDEELNNKEDIETSEKINNINEDLEDTEKQDKEEENKEEENKEEENKEEENKDEENKDEENKDDSIIP